MKSKLLIGSIVLVVVVAIVGVREFVGIAKSSSEQTVGEVPKISTEPVTKMYEQGSRRKQHPAMGHDAFRTYGRPKLEEAKNDEGFEYYLKAQQVIWTFPDTFDCRG